MSAWAVDEDRLVATLSVDAAKYEVDLMRARTREEALDWIHHIAQQPWCTPDIISGLVDVLLVWNLKRIAKATNDLEESRPHTLRDRGTRSAPRGRRR